MSKGVGEKPKINLPIVPGPDPQIDLKTVLYGSAVRVRDIWYWYLNGETLIPLRPGHGFTTAMKADDIKWLVDEVRQLEITIL